MSEELKSQETMPALVIEEILHWGVAPDGSQVVLIVQSASQGPVRLVTKSTNLVEWVNALQHAKLQAATNAAQAGGVDDLIALVPVENFEVSRATGGKMTIVTFEPGTPNEMPYGIAKPDMAIALGRALVSEGMNAQKIKDALDGKGRILGADGISMNGKTPSRIIKPN